MIVIDATLALQTYGRSTVKRAMRQGLVVESGTDLALTRDGVLSLPHHGDTLAEILKRVEADEEHRATL